MAPTIFGFAIAGAAFFLMSSSITSMLILVLAASLLGAASAIDLPALGGASVTPASFALLFLVLRIMLSPAGSFPVVAKILNRNLYLALYCLYGAFTAFLLPRLFFHTINIPPMRPNASDLFSTSPLQFSSQNITTAVYLIGTLLGALSACVAASLEKLENKILRGVIFVTWAHILFGLLDVVLSNLGLHDWLDIFRNANYSQLNQGIGGFQRIAGIFPEASAYAAFGFGLLAINTELWMRGIKPKQTGITACVMLVMLLLTTSSTAYVSVAGYGLLLIVRILFTPMRLPLVKKFYLIGIMLAAAAIMLGLEVFLPAMSRAILDILHQMTFGKLQSVSGLQRSFWAQKGWEAFWTSSWFGIGAGSFRGSGIISAAAGSAGVFGLVTLPLYLWTVLKPLQARTHDVRFAGGEGMRIAFGWAAVVSLIPAVLEAPSADPGLLFGIFAGIATSQASFARKSEKISFSRPPHGANSIISRR